MYKVFPLVLRGKKLIPKIIEKYRNKPVIAIFINAGGVGKRKITIVFGRIV